ncbi:uroporphyrinogen decarboxylase family protein [Alkalibacter mobilis]|uniref:uroporphyrinogen decarboxylase family protein n=1 Tax=Alkalibacter mobilis TaxID=2787712 RepID=UPI00189E90AA|nr:uroporphyrinogen decarboxylase family protein [Alkalibacter mobilis]MBF7097673.1 hypothetical protein [Alkalibacter mobilis]
MNRRDMYNERINRIKKSLDRDSTLDRVPVVPKLYGWLVEYYGYSFEEFYQTKPEIAAEIYKRGFDEFDYDGVFNLNNVTPLAATAELGGGLYTLSDKGIQASNLNAHVMQVEDYPEITKDFIGFCRDEIFPRKFEMLSNGNTQEAFEALKVSYEKFIWYMGSAINSHKQIEEYGCPVMWGKGGLLHPIDWIMDYFRDFSGMMGDLRRKAEDVKQAADSLQNYFEQNVYKKFQPFEDGHGVFWPMHIAPFLKPKDFEKFFYPYFKRTLEFCIDNKIYAALCLEGNWEPYYDILQDLPDNKYIIGSMEKGDYKKFKESLGKKMVICGGIPSNLLAFGSKQECIDHTKKLIDDCADGGGFIVDTDVSLLSLSDAKADNLKAVIETVKEYGKY